MPTKDPLVNVRRYHDSVEQLLHDIALEDSGYTIDTYFDTADVRNALLGAQAYGGLHTPFKERFEQPRASVQVLFSAGWMGPVRLLPPHQSELLALMALDFGVDVSKFGAAVDALKSQVTALPRNHASEAINDADAAGLAAQSIPLFKQAEMSRLPWPERLYEWTATKNVLDLETITPDYSEVILLTEFVALYRTLSHLRPDTPRNNFADSAAIVSVLVALREANKTKRVPILYVGTSGLWEAIRQADIASEFQFEYDGESVSVLRDYSYFMARGILTPRKPGISRVSREELESLRDQLRLIADTKEPLSELLIELNLGDERIGRNVLTFLELCFYTNVWLPYGRLYRTEVEELGAVSSDSLNDERQRIIHDALQTVRKQLEQNANIYTRISNLWERFNGASKRFRSRVCKSPELEFDFIRTFGAFRFVPPPTVAEAAQSRLHMIAFGKELEQRTAMNSVLIGYENARNGRLDSREELGTLAVILWTLELDKMLAEIFTASVDGWFTVIRSAALVRTGAQLDQVETAIGDLKILAELAGDPGEVLRLNVGAAYLSFHLALRRGYRPSWTRDATELNTEPPELIDAAVHLAQKAASATPPKSEYLSTYALNQCLYYSVANGNVERDDLRDLSKRLVNKYGPGGRWDYRFEDTLARYFYLLSRTTVDEQMQKEHANIAKQHIDRAFETAQQGDPDVNNFRTTLQTYRDSLFADAEVISLGGTE